MVSSLRRWSACAVAGVLVCGAACAGSEPDAPAIAPAPGSVERLWFQPTLLEGTPLSLAMGGGRVSALSLSDGEIHWARWDLDGNEQERGTTSIGDTSAIWPVSSRTDELYILQRIDDELWLRSSVDEFSESTALDLAGFGSPFWLVADAAVVQGHVCVVAGFEDSVERNGGQAWCQRLDGTQPVALVDRSAFRVDEDAGLVVTAHAPYTDGDHIRRWTVEGEPIAEPNATSLNCNQDAAFMNIVDLAIGDTGLAFAVGVEWIDVGFDSEWNNTTLGVLKGTDAECAENIRRINAEPEFRAIAPFGAGFARLAGAQPLDGESDASVNTFLNLYEPTYGWSFRGVVDRQIVDPTHLASQDEFFAVLGSTTSGGLALSLYTDDFYTAVLDEPWPDLD